MTIDRRLEDLVTPPVTTAKIDHLCTNAVLCARDDLDLTEPDLKIGNVLTVLLSHVLSLGLNGRVPHLASFDPDIARRVLNAYTVPRQQFRRGRDIGDRCLFLTSQELIVDRNRNGLNADQLVGLGQHAYSVAAAHANSWSTFEHRLYSALAERFTEHRDLLGLAGVLIGFTPSVDEALRLDEPVITLEDVLEALSRFRTQPTAEHWDCLRHLADRHRYVHPEFVLTIPPRPVA